MLTICRYLCKHTNCASENLNVYICFSYNKDQHACCCFAPTQTRSNEGECKILLQKHKVLKMERIGRVRNLSGEGLWTFPLSGGECVNSAFWSQSEIERLLVRRTAEGLRHNQSTPPRPPTGLSGCFTCGWAQAAHWWRKKAWKSSKQRVTCLCSRQVNDFLITSTQHELHFHLREDLFWCLCAPALQSSRL